MSEEKCQRCGVLGHDRRTLWMACFANMAELGVPLREVAVFGKWAGEPTGVNQWGGPTFSEPVNEEDGHFYRFYQLRVCKGCRGAWMGSIREWFRENPDDVCRWNSDEQIHFPEDNLPALVAKVEELRTEHEALRQRINALVASARHELSEREVME